MPQSKIRNVQGFRFLETEGLFSKALGGKLADKWLYIVASKGGIYQSPFGAQMVLVLIQRMSVSGDLWGLGFRSATMPFLRK
jgi:hypothetical protein